MWSSQEDGTHRFTTGYPRCAPPDGDGGVVQLLLCRVGIDSAVAAGAGHHCVASEQAGSVAVYPEFVVSCGVAAPGDIAGQGAKMGLNAADDIVDFADDFAEGF